MKRINIFVAVSLFFLMTEGLYACREICNSQAAAVNFKFKPFEMSDVRLNDVRLLKEQERNKQYLLSFNNDHLMYTFRMNAGLPSPGEPPKGWSAPSCDLRGHFEGHFLSALALMYQSTGEENLKEKGAELVSALAKCQEALGKGYLSAFPESFLDRLESGQSVWAPYYTIHKIMAGLLDQYQLCGNKQALKILEGMVDYFYNRNSRFTVEEASFHGLNEEGGICEVLWNYHAVTGCPKAAALADKLEKRSFWNPMAIGVDNLTGRHGNTHIPLAVGIIRRYELTGQSRYLNAADFFWDRVVNTRSFATGGSTTHESWGPPFMIAQHGLDNTNHETCKTYNMLKLTRHLFCLTGLVRYADYYERAFLNGIIGTQGPNPGNLQYYVPQGIGYKRVFGNPYDTFWCCHGTGIETWSKLADSIYYHNDDALVVNLFISSRVDWKARGVQVEQQADFPNTDALTLKIKTGKPQRFGLHIRIPYWTAGPAEAWVNGKKIEVANKPASYLKIERNWHNGDTVKVRLPMDLHIMPLPDDPYQVAFLYGPVVLAGIVEGVDDDAPLISWQAALPQPEVEQIKKMYFLADTTGDLSWLQPVKGNPATFRAVGQPFPITFIPFNRVIGQRYGLYWPVLPRNSDRHKMLDNENKAADFIKRATVAEINAEKASALYDEYRNMINQPISDVTRNKLTLATADVFRRIGQNNKAAELVLPLCEPFIPRDYASIVLPAIGHIDSVTDVRPLLSSVGGDGSFKITEKLGRKCVQTDVKSGRPYIYFALPPNSLLRGIDKTVRMTVDYYADWSTGCSFWVEYVSSDTTATLNGAYTPTEAIRFPDSAGWHQKTLLLPRALFNGRQNFNSDLRISGGENCDVFISDIKLSLVEDE